MLKRLFVLIALFLISMNIWAQEKPHFTQYIFNNYLLNPALSGIENYIDVKAGHRMQWAGIKNAPRTTFFTANWNLNGSEYLWSNPLSLPDNEDNEMSRSYTQYYTSSPAHHGMGLIAVSDKSGPISRIDAGLTYAYHLKINNKFNLSVGAYAGISRFALDKSALQLETTIDPAISMTNPTQFAPDLAIGTWFYGARFFAGAAVQQVIPQHLSFSQNSNYGSYSSPIAFVTSGYKFYLEEDVSLIPSIMLQKGLNQAFSFDINLKAAYKEKFWIGTSYRKSDSFSGLLGFNLNNFVNLTYAYDMTISDLKYNGGSSHEIVLGFQLGSGMKLFSNKNWF